MRELLAVVVVVAVVFCVESNTPIFCYFSFGLVWNLSSKIKRGVIVYFFVQHRWGCVACHFHAYLHKYVSVCADVRL